MRTLLTAAGFIDITINADGTVDATKDGIRYSKMYISGRDLGKLNDETVMTQEVSMTYEHEE